MSESRTRSWTIREATAADLPAIRALYRATWGYSRPEAFDRWRYLDSPDGPCPVALAVDGERLAGAYTLWPVRLRIGREVVLGAQSMDTMTHPDYQGQGIFTALAPACFEMAAGRGFEIVYGFPNPLSYPGFVRRLNFDHTGGMTHWIRPVLPSKHPRVPKPIGKLADLAARLMPSGHTRGYDIVMGRPADDTLDTLLANWRDHTVGCSVARDLRWLDWRYAADTENDYEWICAYKRGSLMAAGVWGMRNAQWGACADGRAHVTELMGMTDGASRAVLARMIARARAKDAMLIETITNIPSVISGLRRCGFIAHRKAPYIVRALTARTLDTNIHTHDSWHIVGGDVDTF